MLEYLIQLPYEALGLSMLGFLEIVDIIQLENAAASHEAQQFLKSILPYCPPIAIPDTLKPFKFNKEVFKFSKAVLNWFQNRKCSIQEVHLDIETLSKVNIDNLVLDNVVLYVDQNIILKDTEPLKNPNISGRVTRVKIKGKQDPAVMKVLFSLLSSIHSLDIKSSNISQWMEHIKQIGPCLRELYIPDVDTQAMIKTITEYCPYLEKLCLRYISDFLDNSIILNTIAINCPHLHRLVIFHINYTSSAEADADLTAFAEKCPQLEELSLNGGQFTEKSIIALAQHCSRLKKLKFENFDDVASLITLSERGLPLQELDVPRIWIPSAEIAAQCTHAFSRIRQLKPSCFFNPMRQLLNAIQFMTGLRELQFNCHDDHLLVPHLLLLLQQGHCAGLETLSIGAESSITSQQLNELISERPQLHKLYIINETCVSDAVLVELAHSCPHLQKVVLRSSNVTEKGVLTMAVYCRQLREIDLGKTFVNEETVRQLAQHCRLLTSVVLKNEWRSYNEGWSSGEIRAMRELMPH